MVRGFGAQLAGKTRGPDHDPNGESRVPHRHSYDVASPEANAKTRRVGDGSARQGILYREALIETGEQLLLQQWEESPAAMHQEARRAHEALSAELDAIAAGDASAAPGRAAAIRIELAKAVLVLQRWRDRLRHIDLEVLRAILRHLDFATGRMFPSEERIARKAGCSRGGVRNAKRRLQANGLLDWVRRTVKTGNQGQFAPQREQTSNAYEFAPLALMAKRTRERFLQLLARKLDRLRKGLGDPSPQPSPPAPPPSADVAEQRRALASLSDKLASAST